jgi:hypothetical protein
VTVHNIKDFIFKSAGPGGFYSFQRLKVRFLFISRKICLFKGLTFKNIVV